MTYINFRGEYGNFVKDHFKKKWENFEKIASRLLDLLN